MIRLKVKVGQEVALNLLDDCTWFKVAEIDDFSVGIVESHPNATLQWVDISWIMQVRDDEMQKKVRG